MHHSRWDDAQVRQAFPALALADNGVPRLYADAPGGTQVAQQALARMNELMVNFCANDGGVFKTSELTMEAMRLAHEAAGSFFNCDPDEVVFGLNTSHLLFHFAGMMAQDWRAGDNIVLTRMDHDANVAPWLLAAQARGVAVRWLEFDLDSYHYRYEQLAILIDQRTRFVACNYASNYLGTINNVNTIIQAAKSVHALTMVDAVQAAAHFALDVRQLDCDLMACSPYKFFGPHAGLLYIRRALADRLTPLKVRPSPMQMPYKHAPGTPSFEAQAATRGAIEHLQWLATQTQPKTQVSANAVTPARALLLAGFANAGAHELSLTERFLAGISAMPKITLYGPQAASERVPTFSITLADKAADQIASALARDNIYVWSGSFYAYEIAQQLKRYEGPGVVRIGFAHYNTVGEVDHILAKLEQLVK
jgi:cysteine desulfurase family protein (TIGR01976 family)